MLRSILGAQRLLIALLMLTSCSKSAPKKSGPCKLDADCPLGKICVTQSAETKTCRDRGKDGDTCDSDGHCIDGLMCRNKFCYVRRSVDEPCSNDADCSSDLVCDTRASKCQRKCARDSDCSQPQRCIRHGCRKPAGQWESCDETRQCSDGLVCVGRTCNRQIGETCPGNMSAGDVFETDAGLRQCGADGGVAQLTAKSSDRSGAVSPDGKTVVFHRVTGTSERGCDLPWTTGQIVQMDLSTRVETVLVDDGASCFNFASVGFLSDGSGVVVYSKGCDVNSYDRNTCLYDAKTKSTTVIAHRGQCAFLVTAGRFRAQIYVEESGYSSEAGRQEWSAIVDRSGHQVYRFPNKPSLGAHAVGCDMNWRASDNLAELEAEERKW